MMNKMNNNGDWGQKLTPEQQAVLREGATEPAYSGKLLNNKQEGIYLCGACRHSLFKSDHKFDSGSGWPSFYDVLPQAIEEENDSTHGMERTEVVCQKCQSHLGHVFNDAPQTPTNLRYCINSLALKFQDEEGNIIDG